MACNNDDEDATPDEFFTATIDGQAFAADVIVAIEDNTLGEPIIFMSGTENSTGDAVGLNIPVSIPVNVAQAIDELDFGITFTNAEEDAFFTVGEITLTDKGDNNMAGNFSFTATNDSDSTDVRVITNGAFSVTY